VSKYKIWNGPAPTTAAQLKVSTGTSVKTMLQLKAGASKGLVIVGWGYSLDTEQAAAGTVELLKTDVAATVTASVTGDIVSLATPYAASSISLGTAATGYTASAEGSITDTDVFDAVLLNVSTTAQAGMLYMNRFSNENRPYLPAGKILRIRVTAGTSSGMLCWVEWQE